MYFLNMKKLKESLNRPGVAQKGSRRSRLPDFHNIRHMKVVRLSASRTGGLYPREYSWYSFSVGAESIPGPWCGRKEYVTEKSSDTTGKRSRDRPTSSAALISLISRGKCRNSNLKKCVEVFFHILFYSIRGLEF